jgi:uncharacterized protein YqhQ
LSDQKILYGGQAVIEGVMMRGRHYISCAVRSPLGEIVLKNEALPAAVYSSRWSKLPFFRAITVLSDTLVMGTRMLMFSANVAVPEMSDKPVPSATGSDKTGEAGQAGAGSNEGRAETAIPPAAMYGTLAISLTFGIGLFFVLPLVIVNFADQYIRSDFVSNLIEGAIRLVLLVGYIWGIGRMPDVRRIFQYHGAEHKTIAAFEANSALEPALIQKYGKEHPRCGTGFLLTVVVVSILVFALLGRPELWLRILSRIVLIPVVAALSYELIRFSAQHRNIALLDWLVTRPSLALQSLTTREPDEDMVRVAVAAFESVRKQEENYIPES